MDPLPVRVLPPPPPRPIRPGNGCPQISYQAPYPAVPLAYQWFTAICCASCPHCVRAGRRRSPMMNLPPDPARTRPTAQPASLPRLREPRIFNKRSRQRFAQDRTRAMIAHLGREPSYPERIVISRVIAVEWELRRLDAKMDAGEELSGHAMRARLAAENRLRLDLQALGLQPIATPEPAAPDLRRILAEQAARARQDGCQTGDGA